MINPSEFQRSCESGDTGSAPIHGQSRATDLQPPIPGGPTETAVTQTSASTPQVGLESSATTSLRFQGKTFLQPRKAGNPWPDGVGDTIKNSTKVTMAFWLRINATPTADYHTPFAIHFNEGLWGRVQPNGSVSFRSSAFSPDSHVWDAIYTSAATSAIGSAAHWLISFDGSASGVNPTVTVYRNGDVVSTISPPVAGPCVMAMWGGFSYMNLGNFDAVNHSFREADVQMADVALWNGYACTQQDAADLTQAVKRPSDIAAGQLAFYMTGDGGAVGGNALPGDPGVQNLGNDPYFSSTENFTYDFTRIGSATLPGSGNSVQGALTYGGPLTYSPPVAANPYIAESGEGIGFLLSVIHPGAGNPNAHIVGTTRATLIASGRNPTLTIQRAGGRVDHVTLSTDHAYFDNAPSPGGDGVVGNHWLYYDLLSHGVAAIGPDDTVNVVCQRHWILTQEGYCAEFSGPAIRSSPLPPVPPGRQPLRLGYNVDSPLTYTAPYYGNWFRSIDNCYGYAGGGWRVGNMPRDTDGMLRPGSYDEGSFAEGVLVNMMVFDAYDMGATLAPLGQGDSAQYPNVYYDNPAYGTAGFKLGSGPRSIPKRGKIHVVWDYADGHDGDGTVRVCLGYTGNDLDGSLTGGATKGNQVYSWTFNPPVTNGTNGTDYHRTYAYVANDPVGGLGPHGAPLTPTLRVRWTGWARNVRVTFEADPDLPEAAWNVDKFNPPVFHPYLINEALRDVELVRDMQGAAAFGSGLSTADQFTSYDHYTWGFAYSNTVDDQSYPTAIPITSITPITEPEATNLFNQYTGVMSGGFPVKITLASPHGLKHGAINYVALGTCVPLTGTKNGGGSGTVFLDKMGYGRISRPISPTELIDWFPFDPNSNDAYGILDRVYTGAELGNAQVIIDRRRTHPFRWLGDMATQAGVDIYFALAHAIALDLNETAVVADAIAAHFPADRNFYLECGNEPWNMAGTYFYSLIGIGDTMGLVNGARPTVEQMYARAVFVTSQAAKVFRQRWAAAGLDPSRVKALINTGPGGWIDPVIANITACNSSGDPLLRIDEISCNTYWGNLGTELSDPSEFTGRENLTVGQTLDVMELQISRMGGCFNAAAMQRKALDDAGLHDIVLTSYEGGSEIVTVGKLNSPSYDRNDASTQIKAAQIALTQTGVVRSPRWAGIMRTAFLRMQQSGIARFFRFTLMNYPWTGDPQRMVQMQSRYWWTSYMSMDQAGKGDGSDGLWDNRTSVARPYAPYAEGDSVNVDAYALKAWNRLADDAGANHPPILTLPAAVPGVVVGGQPITFPATATDPDPGQTLTFDLLPGAPVGATIDPASGQFRWTPNPDQAGSWTVTVRVTDNGLPPLSATGSVDLRAVKKTRFVPRRR